MNSTTYRGGVNGPFMPDNNVLPTVLENVGVTKTQDILKRISK